MHRTMQYAARTLVAALLATATTLAVAQPYPNKPIKVYVGVPPGGSTDSLTRTFAEWLRESLGQPTVVENRPGANTAVAADAVVRSPADGYSLLTATDALLAMPLLTKLGFDPFKDLAPIGNVVVNRFVLAVHPSVPVNNLQEFIAYAKKNPGKLNYGSSGNAGASHLGLEKFKMATGTHLVHIPYRGAGPMLTDAMSGQVQVTLNTPLAVATHVKGGKLKALAVTGPKRMSFMPDVPTFAEAGMPAFDHKAWFAVFAPAGTPAPILEKLNAEIVKMVASPKMKQKFDDSGVEALATTPEQLTAMMRTETAELAKLIKAANIKVD